MFQRYAVYFTPQGDLATRGAGWLGWDLSLGMPVPQPIVDGLDIMGLTEAPRKYGLHATIKPPFALAAGRRPDDLAHEVEALCTRLPAITLERLEVRQLRGFIALTPAGDQSALAALAEQVVAELDPFRAPPSGEELARRRRARLTATQEHNLVTWGYPFVMEDFHFHITLTGRIRGDASPVLEALRGFLGPVLPAPFYIDSLTLVGEDDSGMFHEIARYPLRA